MTEHVEIREGGAQDAAALLALLDKAIAWMVARGQDGQWGTTPASAHDGWRTQVSRWVTEPGLRIAEINGAAVGASVLTDTPPDHVQPSQMSEKYLYFLISDRDHSGEHIGSALVRRAAQEARAVGVEVLRVDCWAGAPSLVAWYERQGFVKSDTFTVDVRGGWHGQVFEMALTDPPGSDPVRRTTTGSQCRHATLYKVCRPLIITAAAIGETEFTTDRGCSSARTKTLGW